MFLGLGLVLPGTATTTRARPADCRTTAGETDTAAADVAGAEHGGVPTGKKEVSLGVQGDPWVGS